MAAVDYTLSGILYSRDEDADAVYFRLRNVPLAYDQELDDDRRIDFGSDGEPIGIELLNVSAGVNVSGLPRESEIAEILRRDNVPIIESSK